MPNVHIVLGDAGLDAETAGGRRPAATGGGTTISPHAPCGTCWPSQRPRLLVLMVQREVAGTARPAEQPAVVERASLWARRAGLSGADERLYWQGGFGGGAHHRRRAACHRRAAAIPFFQRYRLWAKQTAHSLASLNLSAAGRRCYRGRASRRRPQFIARQWRALARRSPRPTADLWRTANAMLSSGGVLAWAPQAERTPGRRLCWASLP